ncbi:MAG: low molecular weight phosphatase family protein [Alphaproteobacteria bacterium]|nr:low molecular weight phosphatase family protein [Alphaproteobacteria bacterium]
MAEGLLRHLAGSRLEVASAGVRAGELDRCGEVVMNELGIDISRHKPRQIADLDDEETFDLIVSLSPEAHHQALELTRTMPARVEYWPTMDACAIPEDADDDQVLHTYRAIRDHLFRRIKQRFEVTGSPSV